MEWSSLESEGGRPSALYIHQSSISMVRCALLCSFAGKEGGGGGAYTRAFLTSSLGITPSFSS